MTRIVIAAAAVAGILLALPVAAEPQLRPRVEVEAGVVTFGDLFVDAGRHRDVAAMAAPPPGESVELSIPAVFDLATSHGFAWRPVAGFDRVVIRRASRQLNHSDLEDTLAEALRAAGAGDELEITIAADALGIAVPRGALVESIVQQVDYDPATGRFAATLRITPAGGTGQHYTVVGRAVEVIEVPVLRNRLRPDDVIRNDDIAWVRVEADRLPRDTVMSARELIGKSPQRTVTPGRPLRSEQVSEPTVVIKGAAVTMRLATSRMTLTATGRALESGAVGDIVRIQNNASRIVVEAVVEGPNLVAVHPARNLVSN